MSSKPRTWAQQRRRRDNLIAALVALLIGAVVVGMVFYGVWWWTNCASVPYLEAPLVCHLNNSGSVNR